MSADVERRIERLERIAEMYDNRLLQGTKSFAVHDTRLAQLEAHQEKQNGTLQRLEDKFDAWRIQVADEMKAAIARIEEQANERYTWLNRWIYGIAAGMIVTLLTLWLGG